MKKILSLICCISLLLVSVLSGCDNNQTNKGSAFSIALSENIPPAYVGTTYDLSSLIIEETGTNYSYIATFIHPETNEKTELKVRNGKITPKFESDIFVTVTAIRGEENVSSDFIVPVVPSLDVMDKLLSSQGAAGEADSGVVKKAIKNPDYLYGDSSISSLEINFSTPESKNEGSCIFNLSHYSLQAYYSAKVWRNAAVTFWVYNPMEQEIQFKLSSYNPETKKQLSWDSPENNQIQTAKSGQWTQIVFSLYDMDIQQPLFDKEEFERTDSLKLLARYAGNESCTLYIDGLDIVQADSMDNLTTDYSRSPLPEGDYSNLLNTYKVYTNDPVAKLTTSTNGNGSKDAYCFGSSQQIGYPMFHIDFLQATDISGFDYLKFDIYAENAYPFVGVYIRYLDEEGQEQTDSISYDFYRSQWRTIYLNLHYLEKADLAKVVGISFSVHMDSQFVENAFNAVYFDNVSLYQYPNNEPQIPPASIEDNDIISGPLYTANTKPNVNGVCKVATDETGLQKSNSTLLFWTNNASGYPRVNATFMFDDPQDWTNYDVLSFDTHQVDAHYWMRMEIIYLNEEGRQQVLSWTHDTVLTNWLTTNAPLSWFTHGNGGSPDASCFEQVVGFRISVDMAVNITDEVGYIFFDNFTLS